MHFISLIFFAAQLSPTEIRNKPNPTFEEVVSLPIVYAPPHPVPFAEKRDLVYKTDLRLDAYVPDSRGAHGVVVLVHGGVGRGTKPKDWGVYRSWGRTLAASGLVAIIPNQRLGFPARHYDDGASDIRDAMQFVRAHLGELHAADRFCIFAFSGGGTLLSRYLESPPADVKCLVGFYPILDTADTNNPEAEVTDAQRRMYSALSTLANGEASPIPILVARAGRDQIPGVKESIERFAAIALQKGANFTLLNHPTGKHGFDFLNDDDRSREIILTAIEFMKRHL